jgi:hypothetical protein
MLNFMKNIMNLIKKFYLICKNNYKFCKKKIKFIYLLMDYYLDYIIIIIYYLCKKILYKLFNNKNNNIQYYSLLFYNYINFIKTDIKEDYRIILNNFKRLKLIFYNRSFIKHIIYIFLFLAGIIPIFYFFIFLFFLTKYIFKYMYLTLDFFLYYRYKQLIYYYYYNISKFYILFFFEESVNLIYRIDTFLFRMNRIERYKQKIIIYINNKKNEIIQKSVDWADNFILVILPQKLIDWEYDFWYGVRSSIIYRRRFKFKIKKKIKKMKWIIKWYIINNRKKIYKKIYNIKLKYYNFIRNYFLLKKKYRYYRYHIKLYRFKWSVRMLFNWWFWDYIFCFYLELLFCSIKVSLKYCVLYVWYNIWNFYYNYKHRPTLKQMKINVFIDFEIENIVRKLYFSWKIKLRQKLYIFIYILQFLSPYVKYPFFVLFYWFWDAIIYIKFTYIFDKIYIYLHYLYFNIIKKKKR